MIKTTILISAILFLLPTFANAQGVKEQVFVGMGTTAAKDGAVSSVNLTTGAALVILVGRFLVRPFGSVGLIEPTVSNKPSLFFAQLGAVAGPKLTPNFALLGGGCSTMLFPKNGANVYLPTVMFATFTKVTKKAAILTPFTFNERGVGASVLFAYTF